MEDSITYVGLDARKKGIIRGDAGEPRAGAGDVGAGNEPNSLRRLVRKGEREARGPVRCCHEAESCGYALQRQLTSAQVSCEMVVPAFTPCII